MKTQGLLEAEKVEQLPDFNARTSRGSRRMMSVIGSVTEGEAALQRDKLVSGGRGIEQDTWLRIGSS